MKTRCVTILDHGYVGHIESWGSDQRIVEAARMSVDKGFQGWGTVTCTACGLISTSGKLPDGPHSERCPSGRGGAHVPDVSAIGDERLLRYLYQHKHATPFEMAGLVIEVQAPIFVFREWHRHRTQSYNEMSARYVPLPDMNYIPTVERLMVNAGGTNKQAGAINEAALLTVQSAELFREVLRRTYAEQEAIYRDALFSGIPKELARIQLPVGRYSRMRASANLRNWLAFLTLRMAPEAQWEIRQYANAVGALIAEEFPRTWQLFAEKA